MYQLKTRETENSVLEFIDKIDHPGKREDALRLLDLFSETTKLPAKMWGESMIGFGSMHYKYASGHEGNSMIVGFSPRKAKISLYLAVGFPERDRLMARLGKYTTSVACVYVNKLADIDLDVLKELIERSFAYMKDYYPDL